MRKLLVILVLLSLVGIGSAAFAQTAPVEYTCSSVIPRLDCTLGGPQATNLCYGWDWQTGLYTNGQPACNISKYWNRAIFQICNCPDTATNFRAGSIIGVRMTLLVNGLTGERGAYWAAPDAAMPIVFHRFTDTTTACNSTNIGLVDSFGPGHFYKYSNRVTTITPYTGTACDVPTANETTVYVTDRTSGYTITVADETLALNRWWVEIPLIRIDPNILHNGEQICVKVEFLNQNIGRGICNDCPPVCEGTICLAIVCCAESSTCFFPYFTSSTAPDDNPNAYWNGIAIQNTSSVDGTATLVAHEQGGKVATYTTDTIKGGSMFVRTLDKIPFTGLTGGLPVYIKVVTTFPTMDGFAMMADTSTGESMGYLCRKPCPG